MTARDLMKIFNSYFPNIVVEKWFPGGMKRAGGKRDPQAIRILDINHLGYLFEYHSKNDWVLRSYRWPNESEK